jgi:hypothetical protein
MLLDLLDAIASEFSLSNPCLVADFRSWGDTIRWRVSTSNTSDFFIKEKVFYLDPQEFSLHLELHQYLLDKGGPVTGIRKTNSGKRGQTDFHSILQDQNNAQHWGMHSPYSSKKLWGL